MSPQRYAVLGHPVAHSLSPVMQNAAFAACGLDAEYTAIDAAPAELPAVFRRLRETPFAGWNCTVPHKEQALELADAADPEAARIGSVNTLVNRDGRLTGYSTDGYGILAALEEAFALRPAGNAVLLFGCGGAGRAAAFALAGAGAGEVILANRTASRAEALAAEVARVHPGARLTVVPAAEPAALAAALARSRVVIQATSVGLKPDDPPPFSTELLPPETAVFDMIYRPTPLLHAAAARGCRTAGGAAMLLHQGARSFTLWTGRAAPVDVMRRTLLAALRQRYGGHP